MVPLFLFLLASARSLRYSLQNLKRIDRRRRRCNLGLAIESGGSLPVVECTWFDKAEENLRGESDATRNENLEAIE